MTPEQKRSLLLLGLFGLGCYALGRRAGIHSVDPIALLDQISTSKSVFLETPAGDFVVLQIPEILAQAKGA